MNDERLTVDDTRPILAAIRERGIRVDPMFAGEIRQLMSNAGTRMRYQRADGLDVDGVSELLFDRGYTVDRLSTPATLAMLEILLTPAAPKPARVRATRRAVDTAEQKARGMRNRKYVCSGCGQVARGTRSSALACVRCLADVWARFSAIVAQVAGNEAGRAFAEAFEDCTLRRVDPLPEEILETAKGIPS